MGGVGERQKAQQEREELFHGRDSNRMALILPRRSRRVPFDQKYQKWYYWTPGMDRTIIRYRGTPMILRIGLLVIGQAQTLPPLTVTETKADSTSLDEWLRSFQRRFPPELWSPGDQANFSKKCVSRSPGTQSLVFRPCQPQNKHRLVPPIDSQPQN